MATYYIEAYGANGQQILGNLDGQDVIRAVNPRRALAYKVLKSTSGRPNWSRVKEWRLVTAAGLCLEVIPNRCHAGG